MECTFLCTDGESEEVAETKSDDIDEGTELVVNQFLGKPNQVTLCSSTLWHSGSEMPLLHFKDRSI